MRDTVANQARRFARGEKVHMLMQDVPCSYQGGNIFAGGAPQREG